MKISTGTLGVIRTYGLENGLPILAEAGFEAIDYPLYAAVMNWDDELFLDPSSPAFAEHFKAIAKTIRSCGLELRQCHAPYTINDFTLYPQLQEHSIRAIYAAGYMECPYIVAHPVMMPEFSFGKNKAQALQTSLDYFSAMVPALKDTGVTMCIENLCLTDPVTKKEVPNYGTEPEDLCDVIDNLNDIYGPHFAACLDTGHAVLTGLDPCHLANVLGTRIRVLHIHDNGGVTDDHLIPTRGIINWKEFAAALGASGYSGTFNFESNKYFMDFSKDTYSRETFRQACNLLYNIGRSLADIAEGISR